MISRKKCFKNFFYNFICFNYDFYIITLRMHYMLFSILFKRKKVNCYCELKFRSIRFFKIIYDIFYSSLSIILNILFGLLRKVARNHNDWRYWNASCNKFHQEKWEKVILESNIYQHLQKDDKHKELQYETFDQVIENFLLSGTVFTKTDLDSFYISNDDIIIKSFNSITLLRQDVNEKEKK